MRRILSLALALSPVVVAGVAAAHPGHGEPHVVHDGDLAVGWILLGSVAVAAAAVWIRGKRRA